ncbi:MAG TPA: outer membrane protein assembly factor BamD, partial [bacterium]|nr:outer membrane protein assembly factor BamD [bacterium]HOL35223.1 outer membrane protein assembly factor BamD [bacterium]HPP08709.1 outer membrane protein assembly factor BamD [bacterium]
KRYPDFPEIEDVLKMQREISIKILQKKQLRLVEKFKDPSKKYEAINRAIESDPFNPQTPPVALQLASKYAKSGEMEKAINLYQQVIRDFPATQWAEKARYEMLIHQIKSIPEGTTDVSLFSSVEKQIDLFISDFPSSSYKQKLLDTKTQLRSEIASRLFKVAEIYSKNGKKKSAEIYYNKIKTLYPETEYAKKSPVHP